MTQVRIHVKKGGLTKYGYHVSKSRLKRHYALHTAIHYLGKRKVEEMLVPEITYRRNHHGDEIAEEREKFREDLEYVRGLNH
jgi:Family of unknown function (DUF5771)